jgi:hypothetical protein
MRPDLGLVEAWYMGPGALACIQISIFGNSASVPATMRFGTALVSGNTFYGATYPYLVVTTSGEVVADHERAPAKLAAYLSEAVRRLPKF